MTRIMKLEVLIAAYTKATKLIEAAYELKEDFKKEKEDLRKKKDIPYRPLFPPEKRRLKSIVDAYEELRVWMVREFCDVGEHMRYATLSDFISLDEALAVLQDVITGCEVARESLKTLIKPSVEPELVDKLNSLRKELESLEGEGLDVVVVKNLEEAIMEAEHGHRLASAMVASRVICTLIDKLEGEKDDEKVEYLVSVGAVPKDRKDIQRQILTAMRLSRNFLAHRVDIFPETSDVLTLLGGAFNLSKIRLKLSKR